MQEIRETDKQPFSLPWHDSLPLPKSSQVFVVPLELSLGFQIFLLKLLSHLEIMLDQTVPLNVRCQMMLNWTERLRGGIKKPWLVNNKPQDELKKAFPLKRALHSLILFYVLSNAV